MAGVEEDGDMALKPVAVERFRLRERKQFTKAQVSSAPLACGRGRLMAVCACSIHVVGLHVCKTAQTLGSPSYAQKE